MTPPVVTTETLEKQNQKPIIQFKLYDPATKEGFKYSRKGNWKFIGIRSLHNLWNGIFMNMLACYTYRI